MDNDTTTTDTPDAGSPGEPSLRDDIASALDQVESREPPQTSSGAPTNEGGKDGAQPPAGRVRGPDGKFVASPAPDAAKAPDKAAAPLGKPEAAQAPKQPLAAPAKPQDAAKPDAAAQAPAAPQLRAPVTWKPGAREHWAKLPPEVQMEVARREIETARTLQESHQARQALTHVQGALAPYAQNIAASGRDALSVMGELFKADNSLRHGSAMEKASVAASIIKSYGVDIATLDQLLAGQQPEANPNAQLAEQLRREMQAQLQPVMQHFNRMQGARQNAVQQMNAEAAGEVGTFGQDEAHEFFEDVREDMADIIDMATARGQSISLQDAYERAIRINPQVSDLVSRRAEAERVNAAAAAAQRARRTAASISGSSAPAGAGPGPAGDDRRAAISAAWDDQASS